jgi:16S rRNA (cytosine1402-N4)-methyltransferase
MNNTRHIPVLLQETLSGLQVQPGDTVVDATFGGGGHSQALLETVGPSGRVIGIDRDQSALDRYQETVKIPGNLQLVHANYSDLQKVVRDLGGEKVDAILADLGFSSDQIETPERGLSFMHEGPLDMRLDQSQGVTAAHLVNTLDVSALARIFRTYGDETQALKIAKALDKARTEKPLVTTKELAELVANILPRGKRKNAPHPATKVFQALRIAVNQEHEHMIRFLESAVNTLATGGRLAVISFHSGEDRIVKHFFSEAEKECICPREFPVCRCEKEATVKVVSKKGIRPSDQEIAENPRARSAVLRVVEKM